MLRIPGRLRLVLTSLVASVIAVGGLANSAQAGERDLSELGELIAVHSGKCLEIEGGSLDDFAWAQQFTCTGGANQEWSYVDGALVAAHSGKCLEVSGLIALGAPVWQVTCAPGNSLQAWKLVPVAEGATSRTLLIVAVNSGMCLTVKDASTDDGATVHQWPCDDASANQLWYDRIAPIESDG